MKRYRIVTGIYEVSEEDYANEKIGGSSSALPTSEPLEQYGYDIVVHDGEEAMIYAKKALFRTMEQAMRGAYVKLRGW